MSVDAAAKAYVAAYDRYHVAFAVARLRGWKGHERDQPRYLRKAYNEMIAADEAMRRALGDGFFKPDYIERARAIVAQGPR